MDKMKRILLLFLLFMPAAVFSQDNAEDNGARPSVVERIRESPGNFFPPARIVGRFGADISEVLILQKEQWIRSIPVIVLFLLALGLVYFVFMAQFLADMEKEERTMAFAYVFLFLISVLELLYFVALKGVSWFCWPSEVGWLWTIINFVLYGGVVVFQYSIFNTLAGRITQRGIYGGYAVGIVSAVAGIALLMLRSAFFSQSAGLHIAALAIIIGGQAVQFVINVSRYGLAYGATVSAVYIVCFSAFLLALAHFVGLLLIVYLGYCLVSVLGGMKSGSSSSENDRKTIKSYGNPDERIN